MSVEQGLIQTPEQNFARGIYSVEIPQLGEPNRGKVRDTWDLGDGRIAIVTTDRQSTYDRVVATIPGKGQVLNQLSASRFSVLNKLDISHHLIGVPHPNVTIAKKAETTLPVEVVLRRFMARSSTSTSLFKNYQDGRRNIYGRDFPDGILPNEELPVKTIVTPTTKAKEGHDLELTDEQAESRVDGEFGKGIWLKVKMISREILDVAREYCLEKGLILADSKFEFGFDKEGELMVIDELLTPDSSRFWRKDSYYERFEKGEDPESFDKEVLRRWLSSHGFEGDGHVPVINTAVIDQMSWVYKKSYRMITGKEISTSENDTEKIRQAVLLS